MNVDMERIVQHIMKSFFARFFLLIKGNNTKNSYYFLYKLVIQKDTLILHTQSCSFVKCIRLLLCFWLQYDGISLFVLIEMMKRRLRIIGYWIREDEISFLLGCYGSIIVSWEDDAALEKDYKEDNSLYFQLLKLI